MSPTFVVFLILLPAALSHSQLTVPRPAATITCPLGDNNCPGPCDINFPLDQVTATYRRNEIIKIKYQRNNHPPGGFIRITLVPEDRMMDKEVHDRNAFHYSCWGSKTKVATAEELIPVEGVSLVGTENGEGRAAAYHETDVRIPPVIPNGEYILGWSWFGGTQGGETENTNRPTVEPGRSGFFSDYWTCSKVRIAGGPRAESYTPVFVNDMAQFSDAGCMSANDELGVCVNEPCSATARFRRPRKFRRGDPNPITAAMFREGGIEVAEADDDRTGDSEDAEEMSSPERPDLRVIRRRACRCLELGSRCWRGLASRTNGRCVARTAVEDQSARCRRTCCTLCRRMRLAAPCMSARVRDMCS